MQKRPATRIFITLDTIENLTGKMAHENEDIAAKLDAWNRADLKDSYFQEFLNKYLDKLVSNENNKTRNRRRRNDYQAN